MFLNKPQRTSMDDFLFPRRKQAQPKNFLDHYRTKNGEFDLEKIFDTAYQVKEVYDQFSPLVSQVSPLVTKFIKKK